MNEAALAVAGVLWVKAILFSLLYLFRGKAWVKVVFLQLVRLYVLAALVAAGAWTWYGLVPTSPPAVLAKRCSTYVGVGITWGFSWVSYSQWDKRLKESPLARKAALATEAQIKNWARSSGATQ